jgi:hypothetical protein
MISPKPGDTAIHTKDERTSPLKRTAATSEPAMVSRHATRKSDRLASMRCWESVTTLPSCRRHSSPTASSSSWPTGRRVSVDAGAALCASGTATGATGGAPSAGRPGLASIISRGDQCHARHLLSASPKRAIQYTSKVLARHGLTPPSGCSLQVGACNSIVASRMVECNLVHVKCQCQCVAGSSL